MVQSNEEMIATFQERLQALTEENAKLTQKIRENEVVGLKLQGAIEALQYIESQTEESSEEPTE
ncbi:hypothetical protein SWPG_00011 [Synechococcus phage S-CBM2]|nr:hypothetical protein SWPG_00011 [Synechococcus phage S-CBM2]